MTPEEFRQALVDAGYEDAYIFDGFEAAYAGMSHDGRVIYDYNKMVKVCKKWGMTYEEALEYIDYNPVRTIPYLGEKAPIILYKVEL